MTTSELARMAGIRGIRKVSETTTVVDYANGSCRPATDVECRLWAALLEVGGADNVFEAART